MLTIVSLYHILRGGDVFDPQSSIRIARSDGHPSRLTRFTTRPLYSDFFALVLKINFSLSFLLSYLSLFVVLWEALFTIEGFGWVGHLENFAFINLTWCFDNKIK